MAEISPFEQRSANVDEMGESRLHARHRTEHALHHNLSGVNVCSEGRVKRECC